MGCIYSARQSILSNLYRRHKVKPQHGKVCEVIFCERLVIQMSMQTPESPQPPNSHPVSRKVGDYYFAVTSDNYKIYFPLPVNKNAYLPVNLRRQLCDISCKLVGNNIVRRDFPAVYVFDPLYIVRL